jgi:hypothetical protein
MGSVASVKPPAREVLSIYWDGEETAGFTVHALRHRRGEPMPELAPLDWPGKVEVRLFVLHGEGWEVCVWDVRVDEWPPPGDFDRSIQKLLCGLVAEGFSAAWIGLEGHFADPPRLFVPDEMTGGVLAACSGKTGFLPAVRLDAPLRAISDSDLLALREACGDLAGGP